MKIEDLENITASCGTGEQGQKVYHTLLRGKKGKFGTEMVINVTELKKALDAGARTYTDKKGNKYISLRPKIWEPRDQGAYGGTMNKDQWGQVQGAAEDKPATKPAFDLDDEIPW